MPKLVIVDRQIDHIVKYVELLMSKGVEISSILIFETQTSYNSLINKYEDHTLLPLLERLDRCDIFEKLDTFLNDPENIFLMNVCIEDILASFDKRLIISYINSRVEQNKATNDRFFIYCTHLPFKSSITSFNNAHNLFAQLCKDYYIDFGNSEPFCKLFNFL